MIIFVDANQITGDHRLRLAIWKQLSDSPAVRVVTTQLAIDEATSRFAPMRENVAKGLIAASRHLSSDAKVLTERAAQLTRAEIPQYGSWLVHKWRELGFEVVDIPDVPHEDLTQRAINRVPPFDENGNGYRDTLHWYAFLDLAEESPDDDLVLATEDKAFRGTDGELHPALVAEVLGYLEYRGTATLSPIREVVPPGKYRNDPVDLQDDLAAELTSAIQELFDSQVIGDDVPPSNLGVRDADYITISDPDAFVVESATERELTSNKCLEIRFQLSANVIITKFVLEKDVDNPAVVSEETERRVLLSGVARSDEDHQTIASVEQLRIELHNSPFNLDRALEALQKLQLSDSGNAEDESEAWRRFFTEAQDRPKPRPTTLIESGEN